MVVSVTMVTVNHHANLHPTFTGPTQPPNNIQVHAIERVSFLANLLESLEHMEYDRSIVELVFYSSYDEPLMKQFYNPFFKDISYTDKVLTTQSDTEM